jgi:hypothetical protein
VRFPKPNALQTLVLELRNAAGELVPTTEATAPDDDHLRYLVPMAVLSQGNYVLRYANACDNLVGTSNPDLSEHPFAVGPPAPVPLQLGTLEAGAVQRKFLSVYSGTAPCSAERDAVTLTFAFTPADEVLPYLPTSRFSLWVDGDIWDVAKFGSPGTDGGQVGERARQVFTVFGVCPSDAGVSGDDGLSLGEHKAELRAEIAGLPGVLVTNTVSFELGCTSSPPSGQSQSAEDGPSSSSGCQATPAGMGIGLLFSAVWLWRVAKGA